MSTIKESLFPLLLAKTKEFLVVEKIEGPEELRALIREKDLIQLVEKSDEQTYVVALQGKRIELPLKSVRQIFVRPYKKTESKVCQFCLQQGSCHDRQC